MSKIHDLRSFLGILETSDQLMRIEYPVSINHELANVSATLEHSGGSAPLFINPVSDNNDSFRWKIFSSAMANQQRVALALDCDVNEIAKKMGFVQEPSSAVLPLLTDHPLWKDNVLTGDEIDIKRLPIPTHAIYDGGPFITGGVMVSKHPDNGRGNLSFNRMQVLSSKIMGCNINEWRDLRNFHDAAEAKGKPLDCAVAIGLDPAIMIAAACRYDGDELEIAGAIRGEGIRVSKGITVDLNIPAEAEIVIEGQLLPGERREEGPLAEFHGYYGELWNSPVFKVTAISYRNDPIYQTIIPGWTEHIYLGNVLPREPLLLKYVQHVSSNVQGLHITPYANGFMAVIQLDKKNPGEPRNVILGAFTAHVNIRMCIVVDPDVNIYDPADLLWALTSRVDWGCDIFTIPGAQGHEMDPANDVRGVGTKIGIDATDKGRRKMGARIRYEQIDINKYLMEKG